MQRTYRVFQTLFFVCFLCAALFILLRSGVFLALGLLFLTIYLLLKTRIPKFTLWMFAFGFLLRLFVILFLHQPIESDFFVIYDAAHSLMAGDLSFAQTEYFSLWAYQSAYVVWEAL